MVDYDDITEADYLDTIGDSIETEVVDKEGNFVYLFDLDVIGNAKKQYIREEHQQKLENKIKTLKENYNAAKSASVGDKIKCPTCGKKFTKTSYQQAFCCNKGNGNCKDRYWNLVRG